MTLCELYAKKTAQRSNVKKNTQTGRKYLMDALEQDRLGSRSIDSIKRLTLKMGSPNERKRVQL